MHKKFLVLTFALLIFSSASARAEFIGNAYGGQAEESTRAAAARVFEGYQRFYAGMAQLERRSLGAARESFQIALVSFGDGQREYLRASPLLQGKNFAYSRLGPQVQLLFQFLGPLGLREGGDEAAVLQAYANSFTQTIALIQTGSGEMTMFRFREIQTLINRQILVGTLISLGLVPENQLR
jgi:hypothetical protein